MDLDFTVSEVLDDLMIAQLNKADGISERSFAQLLQSAARVRTLVIPHRTEGHTPTPGPTKAPPVNA
ncbi:hypothetical protein [Rhizobium sp. 2MFCol3.1]|uniref:hypothetical protein n=1 Tax=Rhizobium sp. 2MFCol3.1 TaxID=1246459 RepID=UPI00035EE9C0|nr:hypothetical protein [Rhizobium sp. 2MFCol3.1]